MKLSVIVPVYNVERFLPRCLDSLLRQGMEAGEWEVICVNDGSPDNSAAILAEYEKKYPDVFKVITQENQGLGGARNTGTALAQGEWIAYLDSDDYIIDGAYRYLLDHFCGPIEGSSWMCCVTPTIMSIPMASRWRIPTPSPTGKLPSREMGEMHTTTGPCTMCGQNSIGEPFWRNTISNRKSSSAKTNFSILMFSASIPPRASSAAKSSATRTAMLLLSRR